VSLNGMPQKCIDVPVKHIRISDASESNAQHMSAT
jgi:hypothetical protein